MRRLEVILVEVVAHKKNDFRLVVIQALGIDDEISETGILVEVCLELFAPCIKQLFRERRAMVHREMAVLRMLISWARNCFLVICRADLDRVSR